MQNACKIAETGLVGMLYDMNNPLANIKLCVELLQSADDENKEVYYSIINKNVESLRNALKQISNSFVNEGFALHLSVPEF
ncbi:MAG: hypothetical protein ABIN36_00590 [Ferruginibacter sp.]